MTAAEENGTERKKRRSISGSSARRSQTRSADQRHARPAAKAPTMSGDDHPRLGASMMP